MWTVSGGVPIEQVREGDRVVATDPVTGVSSIETVTGVLASVGTRVVVTLRVAGFVEAETLTATGGHPFWSVTRQAWIPAEYLRVGEQVQGGRQTLTVREVGLVTVTTSYHNLTVTGPHTYHTGTTQTLTHNCGSRWKVGDDYAAPTASGKPPSWSTQRRRFWMNEAAEPQAAQQWGATNVSRMQQGKAPQRYNQAKGGLESMELSHEPVPQRAGGVSVVPRWPQDHARFDPSRRPGY